MRKDTILTLFLVILLAASAIGTAYATTYYSVYIMNPTDPANGALGVTSSGYWVGQIPIQVTKSGSTYPTVSYCMNDDRTLQIGSTYSATLTSVTDTSTWRAVSYILSWYTPTDNNGGAIDQVALWKLLNPDFVREPWLDLNLYNAGVSIAYTATGKDVARQGDLFYWVSPVTGNMTSTSADAGQTVTFTAKLTTSTGAPRQNVKIQFTATLNGLQLNSTYVAPKETHTNSQGLATVNVRVPPDALYGGIIEVKASTKSIWPQRYVDINNPANQDLLALDSGLTFTLSTNLCILGYVMILPESSWGALGALVAFVASFIIWIRYIQPRNHSNIRQKKLK